MVITGLSEEESLGIIARSDLARLACCSAGQPYVVPINYVLHQRCLYGFSTFGRKIEWMRANPLVCVEIDDITNNRRWESVVATGRYDELDESQRNEGERYHAWTLLQNRPNWWEPGYVKTVISGEERPLAPIFFRIWLDEITGHRLEQPMIRAERPNTGLSRLVRGLLGAG